MEKNKIDELCNKITSFFEKAKKPALLIPDYLVWCSALFRPGLSEYGAFNRIYNKMRDVMGEEVTHDTTKDGKPSMTMKYTKCIVDGVFEELRKSAVVQSYLPPMSLNLEVIGNKAVNTTGTRIMGIMI